MLARIEGMRVLMADYRQRIRFDHPEVYPRISNDLSRDPRTRIEHGDACRAKRRKRASRGLQGCR